MCCKVEFSINLFFMCRSKLSGSASNLDISETPNTLRY